MPEYLRAEGTPNFSSLEIKGRPVLTEQQVWDHLSQPGAVVWKPFAELMSSEPESCIDGRSGKPVVGVPGGNLGLTVEAFAAAEAVNRSPLSPLQIADSFPAVVLNMGAFAHHTDTHALGHIQQAIEADPRFGGVRFENQNELVNFITNPPAEQRDRLLLHLQDPANLGCGHVKGMINNPDVYGVRPGLVQDTVRAFFQNLWTGVPEVKDNLLYQVLKGEHREGALVNVWVDGPITNETLIPAVAPNWGETSMFVNHHQVKREIRARVALDLATANPPAIPGVSGENQGSFVEAMRLLGNRFTGQTILALAAGVPIYDVTMCPPKDL